MEPNVKPTGIPGTFMPQMQVLYGSDEQIDFQAVYKTAALQFVSSLFLEPGTTSRYFR